MFRSQLYYPIYGDYTRGIKIISNDIQSHYVNSSFRGIYLYYAYDGLTIAYNKVRAKSAGMAMYMRYCYGDTLQAHEIFNNFFSSGDSLTYYSNNTVYFQYANWVRFYYNNLNNNNASVSGSALYLYYGTNNVFVNNVIMHEGTGRALYNYYAGILLSDHNDIFSNGATLVYYNNVSYPDLASYITASTLDSNSVSVDPNYQSGFDLHIAQSGLDSAAIPTAWIMDDIDSEPRDPLTPDIGADEVQYFPDNIRVRKIVSPEQLCGESETTKVTVRITNYGSNDQTGFDVTLIHDEDTVTENVGAAILMGGGTLDYTFSKDWDITDYGAYEFKSYATLASDVNHQNDTMVDVFINNPPLSITMSPDQSICTGQMVSLHAYGAATYAWSNGYNRGYYNNVSPLTTTTYYVSATAYSGCTTVDSVMVTVNPLDTVEIYNNTCDTALDGVFHATYADQFGCDSLVINTVTLRPGFETILPVLSICDGDSILVYADYQKTAGNYRDTLATACGCDSVLSVDLNIDPVYAYVVLDTICDGDSMMIGGVYRFASGSYMESWQTVNGCDSVYNFHLTVHPVYAESQLVDLCQGDSIFLEGAWRKDAGSYYDTL